MIFEFGPDRIYQILTKYAEFVNPEPWLQGVGSAEEKSTRAK
jgi:hypothetical protein